MLLVAATAIAYHPAWHAGFIWDDDDYVTSNKLLSAPDGLSRIWFSLDSPSQYFPLTYTTFRLEQALWGLSPSGYHLVNILLHAVNALLLWKVLARLNVPGAWLGAAIFALHPVQVESVAWISERKNVLMLFFFLLSLLAWIGFIEKGAKQPWRYYVLALVFYALALFSKTTACTIPAALLLILWLKKYSINRTRVIQIVPFVALGIGMGLLSMWWERYHQGTRGTMFAISLPQRLQVATHAIWFYAGKLIWPSKLTFIYPRWTPDPADLLAYGWLAAVAVAGVGICFARRFVGRSLEVAALFFVTTLSPVLGFIMLYTFRYSFVADHYQYVASIGPIALAAGGISTALGRWGRVKWLLQPAICGALLVTLGVLTWRQCEMFSDGERLWRTTIARNPGCWMAENNLGDVLLKRGETGEAMLHFQKAVELEPDFAEGYASLAGALLEQGQVDAAMARCRDALAIQPDLPMAHYNLGSAYLQKRQLDEAVSHYERAVDLDADFALAQNGLATVLLQKGEARESVSHFQKALAIDPSLFEAHFNFGLALLQLGREDEAREQFNEVKRLRPDIELPPEVLRAISAH